MQRVLDERKLAVVTKLKFEDLLLSCVELACVLNSLEHPHAGKQDYVVRLALTIDMAAHTPYTANPGVLMCHTS